MKKKIICENKIKYFNSSVSFKDYIKKIYFSCINCGVRQLVFGNFIFSGYCLEICFRNPNSHHPYDEFLNHEDDNISFVCSGCNKISINYLTGSTKSILPELSLNEINIIKKLQDYIDKNSDIENKKIKNLISLKQSLEEFFLNLKLNQKSSSTMLARKLLMNFAVELNYIEENIKENDKQNDKEETDKVKGTFEKFAKFIISKNILGKNWNNKLDLVRDIGNYENHSLKLATDEELRIIEKIMYQLINSHFLPDF